MDETAAKRYVTETSFIEEAKKKYIHVPMYRYNRTSLG